MIEALQASAARTVGSISGVGSVSGDGSVGGVVVPAGVQENRKDSQAPTAATDTAPPLHLFVADFDQRVVFFFTVLQVESFTICPPTNISLKIKYF